MTDRITYQTDTKHGRTFIKVRLGRKVLGEIRADSGGYRYWPMNTTACGEWMATVAEVKASLEGAEETRR